MFVKQERRRVDLCCRSISNTNWRLNASSECGSNLSIEYYRTEEMILRTKRQARRKEAAIHAQFSFLWPVIQPMKMIKIDSLHLAYLYLCTNNSLSCRVQSDYSEIWAESETLQLLLPLLFQVFVLHFIAQTHSQKPKTCHKLTMRSMFISFCFFFSIHLRFCRLILYASIFTGKIVKSHRKSSDWVTGREQYVHFQFCRIEIGNHTFMRSATHNNNSISIAILLQWLLSLS